MSIFKSVRCQANEASSCWLTWRPPELWAVRPLVPGLSGTWQARCHSLPALRAKQAADTEVNDISVFCLNVCAPSLSF